MLARRVAVSISLFVVGVVLLLLVGFLSGVLCTDTLNITGEIHSHYCYLRFLFIFSILRFGGRSVCSSIIFLSFLGLSFSDTMGLLLCFCLL